MCTLKLVVELLEEYAGPSEYVRTKLQRRLTPLFAAMHHRACLDPMHHNMAVNFLRYQGILVTMRGL